VRIFRNKNESTFINEILRNILTYICIRTELFHRTRANCDILNSMVSGYIKGSLSRNEFLADYLTVMDSIGAKEDINE